MSKVMVKPVTDKSGTNDFLHVPFEVFKGDPNWVPPLFLERHEHLSTKKNPYFKHAEAQLFVAYQNGKPVGRISAQVDTLHLQRYEDATGQFGFLDAIDVAEVFNALFSEAENWLRQRNLKRARGPFSFSINDETGLLIDGFNRPPNMMMGHARPYFAAHVEANGYGKVKDVFAYEFNENSTYNEVLVKAYKRVVATGKIVVRPLNKRDMKNELNIIMTIFNDAWSNNWGFIPFTEDELTLLGNNLKMLVKEEYVAIAMYQGQPAAMAVTLPNINEWIHDLKGKLLPFGWAKLLPRVLLSKHKSVRLPLMGVRKQYHNTAIGSMLALSVIETIRSYHYSHGIFRGELGWILEDNHGMRNIIESAGAKAYKTYRVYQKNIA
jgi:hypothetical protein